MRLNIRLSFIVSSIVCLLESLHRSVFNSVCKTEEMNALIWSGDLAALFSGKLCVPLATAYFNMLLKCVTEFGRGQ